MANEIQLDSKTFHARAALLLNTWKSAREGAPEEFNGADALVFITGDADEQAVYIKTTAVQTWLLGYEFPGTLMMLTDEKFYFLTSGKKASILEELKQSQGIEIEILTRTKDSAHNASLFSQIINHIGNSYEGKNIGLLSKQKFTGKFIDEWTACLEKEGKSLLVVDTTPGVSGVLAVKDETELRLVETATHISSRLMKNYFVEEMMSIIDEGQIVNHEKLAEMTENALFEDATRKKLKISMEIDPEFLDFCYTPIIQSGGKFDLKSSAVSNTDPLHGGTVVCSLGVRYKQYCSNVGRTYMVNPSKAQEKAYQFLLDLQLRVLDSMKPGAKAKDVYNKALNHIKAKRPDLESYFVKNLGFGMGIEYRESQYLLGPKNNRELKDGMIFNLVLGFNGLERPEEKDPKSKGYALLLIDTVKISSGSPVVLTDDVRKATNEVVFTIEESDVEEIKPEKKAPKKPSPVKKQTAILPSKTRSERLQQDSTSATEQERRKQHQEELYEQLHADGLERFSEAGGKAAGNGEHKKTFRKFESYKREAALPAEIKEMRIVVDNRNESIILPIYGLPVPFHISTLKNSSRSEEGDYVYLRLNFVTPGQAAGKKEDQPFEIPNATFVRSVTFRSSDTYRMNEIYKSISELKKAAGKKEAARKEMADIVEQDKLNEVRGKRPITLPDVFIRPNLEGKRFPGELQIHSNGLRYVTLIQSDKKVDILFNNIRYLFFQPCDSELVVLVHCHLHNPIMIGKKKTKDVQFYREASDASFDETGNRRRRTHYGDEDELQSEQDERRRRALLNKEFKSFAERTTAAANDEIGVDIPFRELGFQGVPFRTNVLLQPTEHCLVHLTDPPFLVVPIKDVEIAHLERVQFGLKNFDLVFVFKDYNRTPVHINTIPMTQLDNVKEWLDMQDVVFSEGAVNLSWPAIMKTITADPAAFFEDGGWRFLRTDDADDSDMSESASEFEMEASDFNDESTEDESSLDASSDDGSDASDSGSDSGEDWDEQERRAKQQDDSRSTSSGKRKDGGSKDDAKRSKKSKR